MVDVWELILAGACLGTFVLEVFAFHRVIVLIKELKQGLGISADEQFEAGDMLKDAIVSIGLQLGEVDKDGKPTPDNVALQMALGNIFGFGVEVAKSRFMEASGVPDISKLPKKQQGQVALLQTFMPMLQGFIERKAPKVAEKAVDNVLDGWIAK